MIRYAEGECQAWFTANAPSESLDQTQTQHWVSIAFGVRSATLENGELVTSFNMSAFGTDCKDLIVIKQSRAWPTFLT